jgi:hypothetical protein
MLYQKLLSLPYVASKPGQPEPEKAAVIEELLDALDTTLDRVRVLYEQYFLGIQKQAPAYLHTDVERKIRELAQIQVRNTALRYRFATLQQKFGSYNSYWRRTLRQIENGTYSRSLLKIGRQAVRTGAELPEEILAAMPRRMREQVVRDREAALALAQLRERQRSDGETPARTSEAADLGDLGAEDVDLAGFSNEPTDRRPSPFLVGGAHPVDESDADFDVDAFFASVTHEKPPLSLESNEAAGPATAAPPPIASQARTGQPRPAPISGSPAATARESTGGGPSTEPAPPRRTTGEMRAVIARVKTEPVPATEAAQPRRTTGQMRAATSRAKTDPGASAEPQQPRRSTSQIRAATPRAKTDPGAGAAPPQPRRMTGQMRTAESTAVPPRTPPAASERRTQAVPRAPSPTQARPERPAAPAPSQAVRPLRVAPGSAAAHTATPVETLAGPFPRTPKPPSLGASRTSSAASAAPSSAGEARPSLPPGISNAEVNTLYAQYVRAKRLLGEEAEPGIYGKLLRTISAQAPKIMQQYKSKGVDFSVVVKDNQVIIRAKPKP